jgi:PAS domain S-box-containing protein
MQKGAPSDANAAQKAFTNPTELQATLNVIPAYAWYAASSGGLTFVNKRTADYLGLPIDHPLRFGIDTGAQWDAHIPLLHPDDHEETRKVWSTCLRTGEAGEVSFRVRNAEGGYRWFLSRAEPLRASDGTILQWVGVNLDIEEFKHAEDALRRSEANLAEAQRLSHTGSWALSPAMAKILYWSEECYRIWGFDAGQDLPDRETVWRRIHPDDRGRVLEETEEALRQRKDYSIQFRIVLPGGTVKHLEAVGHHLFSANGELVQVLGTNVDVTECKRAERAIRENEYELRQIIEALPGMVWSTKPDGGLTHLSQKVLDYSGLRFEDFLQLGWKEFTHPDDFPHTMNALSQAIETGEPWQAVHRLRRADGEYRWHHTRGEPPRDRDGRIIQWYGLTVDIDEGKKAEDRLRRSESYLAEAQRLSHAGAYDLVAAHGDEDSGGDKEFPRTIVYWSDENYRIWGFDPRQGLPTFEAIWQRIHPDDRDAVRQELLEAFRRNLYYHAIEFKIVLPDGTIKHLEATGHHVFSPSGDLVEG